MGQEASQWKYAKWLSCCILGTVTRYGKYLELEKPSPEGLLEHHLVVVAIGLLNALVHLTAKYLCMLQTTEKVAPSILTPCTSTSHPPDENSVVHSVCWPSPQCVFGGNHVFHPLQVGVQSQDARIGHGHNKVGIFHTIASISQGESHACKNETAAHAFCRNWHLKEETFAC